jgi:hypothetical protein
MYSAFRDPFPVGVGTSAWAGGWLGKWPGWAAGAAGPGGSMGAADRAEKYDDTINCSPFLLRGEEPLLIKICGIFLDTGLGFCFI